MEAFAYMDNDSLGLMVVTANTVRSHAFLRSELETIGLLVKHRQGRSTAIERACIDGGGNFAPSER